MMPQTRSCLCRCLPVIEGFSDKPTRNLVSHTKRLRLSLIICLSGELKTCFPFYIEVGPNVAKQKTGIHHIFPKLRLNVKRGLTRLEAVFALSEWFHARRIPLTHRFSLGSIDFSCQSQLHLGCKGQGFTECGVGVNRLGQITGGHSHFDRYDTFGN